MPPMCGRAAAAISEAGIVVKKDTPDRDPNVVDLQGFDVTALAPADFDRHGIVLDPHLVMVEPGRNRAWITHSQFLSEPAGREFDLYERAVARRKARDHVARTGSLKGLRLHRSFPCPGMLRVVSQDGPMVEVQCQACGTSYGVRHKSADDDPPTRSHHETPGDW